MRFQSTASWMLVFSVVCLASGSCSDASKGPVGILERVQERLRANDLEGAGRYLTPESEAAFRAVLGISVRYAYLNGKSMELLGELTATGPASVDGEWASLPVEGGGRRGVLCFRGEDGDWKMDLLRRPPCGSEPALVLPEGPASDRPGPMDFLEDIR